MFYGWVILVIGMVAIAATSPGQSFLVGKFNASIVDGLGIELKTLTFAYGIATCLAAIPLLYLGRLADRFGPRLVMGLSALALGGSCWLIGHAQGPMTLGVAYFLLRFSGQGALGVSASHSTAMWFEKRLGTASGIKAFSMPIAMFLLPPLTTWLIKQYGWRMAYGLLGTGVWVTVLPLVVFLHRNKPEDIGQRVDGVTFEPVEPSPHHPHAHPDAELMAAAAQEQPQSIDLLDDPAPVPDEICFTRAEAMRTSAYWIVTAAMTLNALVGTAFVFLLDDLAAMAKIPGAANQLLMVFAVASAVFSPLAGLLTDRARPNILVPCGSAMLGASCACFAVAGGHTLAWLAMFWLAASQMVIFIACGTLFARYFGRPHHGAIRASLAFTMVIGTSVGPYLAALIAEYAGYEGTLWAFAAISVPVAIAGIGLRRPDPPVGPAAVQFAGD
jgi:OFA family oxalate/formate antiporter-like MFS transporter